ncbi:hypothetical protein [Pararhodobacter marinus]|uniref:hypothetical protein n=1 Tax=Pararhodobacter marinus TaxID=2184063 RepID=UPI0035112819
MTALEKYARLEGAGVWRAGPEAQRRDVVVSLGNASLVIADGKSGAPLSHWSLPAVQRLTRGHKPAIFAPLSDDTGETLELDDPLLIEALDTIRAALSPRRGFARLRMAVAALAVLAVLIGLMMLPRVLVTRTAAIVPPAARAQIGRDAIDAMLESAAGERICADPEGRQAMATLRNLVLGPDWRVMVIAGLPGAQAAHLPGRLIVLGEELITRLDSAEALAGWILAEAQDARARDPLLDVLHHAGTGATAGLLTTGALPDDALRGYARARLTQAPARPDPAAIAQWFRTEALSPLPYAASLPAERQDIAQALNAGEPGSLRDAPLLSDGEWLQLQAICTQ